MKLSIDGTKLLRGTILTILTFFLIQLVRSGNINLLVSPIIAKIVNYSIIPFILLTITTLKNAVVKTHNHDHHHSHTEECECGHDHADPKSFWSQVTVGLVVVSLALAFSWHPKAFGTDMIAQAKTENITSQTKTPSNNSSTTSTNASSDHSAYAPGIINSNEDTVGIIKQTSGDSEASIAMRYGENPKTFLGKKVELDGFVYHPSGLPKNHFILTRFFIFCCVADANPIGITVDNSDAETLKNDTWVRVSGVIQTETLPILDQLQPTNWFPNDSKKPVIIANSIKLIPTPDKPYMIPN